MAEAASPARTQHPWLLHALCTSEARSVLAGRVRQPSVLARRENCQHFHGEDLGRCFTLPPGTRISRGDMGQAWGKFHFPTAQQQGGEHKPPPQPGPIRVRYQRALVHSSAGRNQFLNPFSAWSEAEAVRREEGCPFPLQHAENFSKAFLL